MDNDVYLFFRSITAHKSQESNQNLFAITQGGLDPSMRIDCINEMLKRKDEVSNILFNNILH